MSEFYNIAPTPPQTHEIIPAFSALLKADATLMSAIGGLTQVHDHHIPAVRTPPGWEPDDPPWKNIVVREPITPPKTERQTRQLNANFEVMVEVHETTPNPHQFLSAAHARIFDALVGQSPSLTLAEVVLPVERRSRPTTPQYDPRDHSYFSAAHFLIVLKSP